MMKFNKSKLSVRFSILFLLAFFVLGTVSFADAQTRRKKPIVRKKTTVKRTVARPVAPRIVYYTVPANERIRVRLEQELNSKTARVGDTFETRTVEPVYSTNGVVVIPEGSRIVGRVDEVTAARKGGKPGSIDVSFTSVRLPNGTSRSINGSLTDLDSERGESNNEGTVSRNKMKNRKIIFIGGGGAGGAILGAAVGGGKGALIGAIIGGIGGAIAENQTKGGDVAVNSGTEFGVMLNQAISLPKYDATNP
ncbi:MAG TPA: hypothetical protein VGB02_16695 [Pyrinomonadaceae bacterium]|jgi:hypothetical protein